MAHFAASEMGKSKADEDEELGGTNAGASGFGVQDVSVSYVWTVSANGIAYSYSCQSSSSYQASSP